MDTFPKRPEGPSRSSAARVNSAHVQLVGSDSKVTRPSSQSSGQPNGVQAPAASATVKTARRDFNRALYFQAFYANRLAKVVEGWERRRFYQIKCEAISELIIGGAAELSESSSTNALLFVFDNGRSLHAPLSELTPQAQALVKAALWPFDDAA